MTIELKVRDVIEIRPALMSLSNKSGMSAKVAYNIGKLMRKVNQEYKDYDKARIDLIQRLGVDEDNKLKQEHRDEFNEEHAELLDADVTLDGVQKIHFSDIEGVVELTPAIFADLDPVVVFELPSDVKPKTPRKKATRK